MRVHVDEARADGAPRRVDRRVRRLLLAGGADEGDPAVDDSDIGAHGRVIAGVDGAAAHEQIKHVSTRQSTRQIVTDRARATNSP